MRRLKDREVKALVKEFVALYPTTQLDSAKTFDEHLVEHDIVYVIDGAPLVLRTTVGLLPSLKFQQVIESLPHIIVDMGAVSHIVNGADVMRPGIRQVQSEFGRDALVLIVDEKYGKPIAIGLAELGAAEMRLANKGKAVRNVHYVGDQLWNSFGKTG